MFLSQATFVRKQRRAGLIHEINCAFVDLDVYKLGLQPDEQTIELVLETARWAVMISIICWPTGSSVRPA